MAWLSVADLEEWALGELAGLGFARVHGSALAPDVAGSGRGSWRDAILRDRLERAVRRLNPDLADGVVRDVLAKVCDRVFPDEIAENRRLHEIITRGVQVDQVVGGETVGAVARLVDWEDRENDWLAVNHVEIAGKSDRRPDILLYLNGLPIVVFELKGTEGDDLEAAFNQIQTYRGEVPELFRTNLFSVVSDRLTARYGSISADMDRFMRWRTIHGETLVDDRSALALETLIRGLLDPAILLQLLRRFVVFEDEGMGRSRRSPATTSSTPSGRPSRACTRPAVVTGRGA